jgi:hypothetical protein
MTTDTRGIDVEVVAFSCETLKEMA